jgi:hypothetical protein
MLVVRVDSFEESLQRVGIGAEDRAEMTAQARRLPNGLAIEPDRRGRPVARILIAARRPRHEGMTARTA